MKYAVELIVGLIVAAAILGVLIYLWLIALGIIELVGIVTGGSA